MSIRNNNIKNYICITSTELPSYMQASIVVPKWYVYNRWNKLKVKDIALTSNYYRVSVIFTDRYNQEVSKNMIVAVSAM